MQKQRGHILLLLDQSGNKPNNVVFYKVRFTEYVHQQDCGTDQLLDRPVRTSSAVSLRQCQVINVNAMRRNVDLAGTRL